MGLIRGKNYRRTNNIVDKIINLTTQSQNEDVLLNELKIYVANKTALRTFGYLLVVPYG